jgi:hypothetical protein
MIDLVKLSKSKPKISLMLLQHTTKAIVESSSNYNVNKPFGYREMERIMNCSGNPIESIINGSEQTAVSLAYSSAVEKLSQEKVKEDLAHYVALPSMHELTCAYCPRKLRIDVGLFHFPRCEAYMIDLVDWVGKTTP